MELNIELLDELAGFFLEKLLRGEGGRNRDSHLRGGGGGGIHVSVYMHVNVSTNNDSTK